MTLLHNKSSGEVRLAMSMPREYLQNLQLSEPTIWTVISFALLVLFILVGKFGSYNNLFANMFGFGTIEYTCAAETVALKRRKPTTTNGTSSNDSSSSSEETISLLDLVKSVVPPLRLSPLLFNGHLQTIYVASGRGRNAAIHYKRHIFVSDHKTYPGQFATDWVVPAPKQEAKRDRALPPRTHSFTTQEFDAFIGDANEEAQKPLLIVLHGLSGGSHEQYIRQSLTSITASAEQQLGGGGGRSGGGFAAVVVNARGCCYSKITSDVLFNARATWDIRQFVRWARKQWPRRRLFGIGFSLGANIMCNYLGEEGDACELEAAVLVGNPWNLDVSNALLCSSFIGLHVYQRAMGAGLKKVFERHVDQISKNPNIDIEKVRSAKYLFEWDRYVQCASWGYPTESAYYRDASSVDAALNIKIPVLSLAAKDDPVCSDMAVPYTQFQVTPYIVMCATSIGGHLGWFELGGDRWSNKVIHGFLTKFVRETDGHKHPDTQVNGQAQPIDEDRPKPTFDPILRRMHIPA